MLIFISDLHLRSGARLNLSRPAQFKRFWQRIEQSRRGEVAHLCIVGDLFDLVRTPEWLATQRRPYHPPSAALALEIERIVDATLQNERAFLTALRERVEEGALQIHFVQGNHDRLLDFAPNARAAIRKALAMKGADAPFPNELRFAQYGVLAYHGHTIDHVCHDADGAASFSDFICPELIVRFPLALRTELGFEHPHLDDIDDVRPVIAVPTWVRALARGEKKAVAEKISTVWGHLVTEFLDNREVAQWFKDNHRRFKLDFAAKMKLLLSLSAKQGFQHDTRFINAHDVLFKLLDVKFARAAYESLSKKENKGLRYVVNGHTHFAGMTPLGYVQGQRGCYFNVGTWRTVHQLGNVSPTEPAFLAYDAMGYLAFFPPGDPLQREFEWWHGAAAAREAAAQTRLNV